MKSFCSSELYWGKKRISLFVFYFKDEAIYLKEKVSIIYKVVKFVFIFSL